MNDLPAIIVRFLNLYNFLDPYIKKTGDLTGLIIDAPVFLGWDSFGAMVAHFRFGQDHHKHIKKVGLVTDSVLGNAAEHLASHFVSAEIKHFHGKELEAAKQWVTNPS